MEKKIFECKKTPYMVPKDFFADFHGKISERIKEERKKRRNKIIRITSSVAAAVAIIVSSSIAINDCRQNNLHEQEMIILAESPERYMSDEKLESWVNFYENDLFINTQYNN